MDILDCIHICSGKFYNIVGYELKYRGSNRIQLFSPNELRVQMLQGLRVSNLKLGSDLQIVHDDVICDPYERFIATLSSIGWVISYNKEKDYYTAYYRGEPGDVGVNFIRSGIVGKRMIYLYQNDVERYEWNQVVICHLIVSDVVKALDFIRGCKRFGVTASYCCKVLLGVIYKSTSLEKFAILSRMEFPVGSSNAVLNSLPLLDNYNNRIELPAAYKVHL